MSEDRFCYIGRSECGCIRTAVVDEPEHRKDVGNALAKMVRDGLAITRHECRAVREMEWECGSEDCPHRIDPNGTNAPLPDSTSQHELEIESTESTAVGAR